MAEKDRTTCQQALTETRAALETCEGRFRNTIDRSVDGVLIIDRTGTVRIANSAVAQMLERSTESLQGHPFGVPIVTGEAAEIDLVRGDRQIRVAEMRVVATEWDEKQVALTVLRDVTERKRATARMRQSEERYRLLAKNTVDAIWRMDLDTTFTYINPAIEPMTGFTPEEWIGTTLRDHCDAENFAQMHQVIQEALARLPADNGLVFEATMRKKNGDPIPVEITGRILTDEEGRPVGLQGVTRDITERKRAARKIENLARFPAENPNPVLRVTPEGRVRYANPAATAVLDAWAVQADGLLPETWRQVVAETFAAGLPNAKEAACTDRTFSLTFAPVTDQGYVNIYGLDITARKEARARLRRYAIRLETLLQIDQAILEARSMDAVLIATLTGLKNLIDCEDLGVMLVDRDVEPLHLLLGRLAPGGGIETMAVPTAEFRPLETLRRGEPHQIADLEALEAPTAAERRLLADGIRSHLSVPLSTREGLIGALNLAAVEPHAFTEADREITQELADQLAIALRQGQLRAEVAQHTAELERRIKERTAELQRIVDLMAGREIRMAELKDVIRQLRAQLKAAGLEPIADDPLFEEVDR